MSSSAIWQCVTIRAPAGEADIQAAGSLQKKLAAGLANALIYHSNIVAFRLVFTMYQVFSRPSITAESCPDD
jgi:hypothetical protein